MQTSRLLEQHDDSEFAFECPSRMCSHPIATADEIFYNGKIRPLNLYGGGTGNVPVSPPKSTNLPRRHRSALRKLMSEEREEDLTGVSPESYCVWRPKGGGDTRDDEDLQELSSSLSQSKIQSNSVGFSKRWKLRNILYVRSSREGDDETNSDHREEEEEPSSKVVGEKEEKESEETKRQTFVPFNKDMMGILKNVNGLSRHLRSF